jgi:branched-chain amino acid transport system ATP-binding protein
MSSLLEVTGLSVTYGGVHANHDVDLRVEPGSFVGLIGPNGAGKTTFVDAITGFAPVASGEIRFGGEDLTRLAPHLRARRGLARTFQSLELFEDLTVHENLLVAVEEPRWFTFALDIVRPRRRPSAADDVTWALDAVGLGDLQDRVPSDLSHGQRKLVGVARGLVARPRLLLLDEPAAGLDTAESQVLGAQLRRLVEGGTTILMIDHDMGLVLNVCDDIYVLDFGKVIAHGPPGVVRSDSDVVAAYLGEKAGEAQAREGDAIAALERQVAGARADGTGDDR